MQRVLTINIEMKIFIISPHNIYGLAHILSRVRNLKLEQVLKEIIMSFYFNAAV